ncbi:hypothetical protein [Pseudorhodobacter sp.]|uniref:hypothetical protein n=1 Tax=Pseudorhodobacter sp. TaxID=1934400 RepID=UPI002AFF7ECB|nr:hypothetical protein [Pseudorhodobacter sp.]
MLITAKSHLSALHPCLLAVAFAVPRVALAQGLTLYMVEQPGCIYCARRDTGGGDASHKGTGWQAASLQRIQLRDPLRQDVRLARKAAFTPTFVLMHDGQEPEQAGGYLGEDFFYAVLGVGPKNAALAPDQLT